MQLTTLLEMTQIQQRLANTTYYKSDQQGHYRKDCFSSAGRTPMPDQTPTTPMYSPPTIGTQMVKVSYAVSQSKLMACLNEATRANQTNQQLRKSIQEMPSKQNLSTQPLVNKSNVTPKTVTTKTSPFGKKTVQFAPKPTISRSKMAVTSI